MNNFLARINWSLSSKNESLKKNADCTAEAAYYRSIKKGTINRILTIFGIRSFKTLRLNKALNNKRITEKIYEGLQTIDINKIKGIENEQKADDFDINFNILKSHYKKKWISIAKLVLQDISFPIVELIQINSIYFVQNGYEYISVARALGQNWIDAIVYKFKT